MRSCCACAPPAELAARLSSLRSTSAAPSSRCCGRYVYYCWRARPTPSLDGPSLDSPPPRRSRGGHLRPYLEGWTRAGALAGSSRDSRLDVHAAPAASRKSTGSRDLIEHGPWASSSCAPTQHFGLAGSTRTLHAMIWSMIANVGPTWSDRASAAERGGARPGPQFVDVYSRRASRAPPGAGPRRPRRCRRWWAASSARGGRWSSSRPMPGFAE